MKAFNLKKTAASDAQIADKMIQENREDMSLDIDAQGVVYRNINTSISKKDNDNTIPFNKQLDAARNNKDEGSIIEAKMDKEEVLFGEKGDSMMPINEESEKFCKKKEDDFKKESDSSKKDTAFWDKYVGISTGENPETKVIDNTPPSASQLFNKSAKSEAILASLRDADAMLFHIYATAAQEKRELNNVENQQITDINSGKMRLFAQTWGTQIEEPPAQQEQQGEISFDLFEGDNGEGLLCSKVDGKVLKKFPDFEKARHILNQKGVSYDVEF